jgi:glutathione peroxidase
MILISILLSMVIASNPTSIHEFSFKSIDGKTIKMSDFKGKKILIVNTASKCGYTPQYAELEELNKKFNSKLVIIGFPANNFMGQEPGSNAEIQEFCTKNYGVSFLMAEKVSVKGKDMNEIFRWLTAQPNPDFEGDIKWNFEKFLLDENGKLLRRFRSGTRPMSSDITALL